MDTGVKNHNAITFMVSSSQQQHLWILLRHKLKQSQSLSKKEPYFLSANSPILSTLCSNALTMQLSFAASFLSLLTKFILSRSWQFFILTGLCHSSNFFIHQKKILCIDSERWPFIKTWSAALK